MHVGFGNLGGIISGFSFRPQDAPRYFSGHGLLIGMISMSLVLSVFMHVYLVRENARRDEAMQAKGLTLDSYTEEMKHAEREKGDDATVSKYELADKNVHSDMVLAVLPLHCLILVSHTVCFVFCRDL
jgi:hypothetical protein